MRGTKHQQLRENLKVALATSRAANKVAIAATKAHGKAPSKFTLAASERATNAFLDALAANKFANDALAALAAANDDG